MKILVTGRAGQVAQSLAERAGSHKLVFAARPGFDLLDPASIEATIAEVQPDLIISAAAYTAVDQAEDEPELAMAANGEAPGVIGRAAAKVGAPVLHLSTDYVFDGSGERAWAETDPTGPIGIYGKSKLAGEEALASSGAPYAIMRTAWVYSPFGSNFVKTMLRLAETREELNVVADQYGNPTSALDIADALMTVVNRWHDAPEHGANAVYHVAGRGTTNWADFARAIFSESAKRGGPSCTVNGIATADYPTKAIRPANSRLDCTRFHEMFDYTAPKWDSSLRDTIARVG
ncbi:dTDP-4-dehydrorhamnose reductase [Qipengyuania sp. GPGPB31]|uniref:dTDP-4-dehydrorhamnose reductase n=1 Tax=Qipengyuania sp. GPGPB31 TaxID=3023518 RepID=UPI0031345FEB